MWLMVLLTTAAAFNVQLGINTSHTEAEAEAPATSSGRGGGHGQHHAQASGTVRGVTHRHHAQAAKRGAPGALWCCAEGNVASENV